MSFARNLLLFGEYRMQKILTTKIDMTNLTIFEIVWRINEENYYFILIRSEGIVLFRPLFFAICPQRHFLLHRKIIIESCGFNIKLPTAKAVGYRYNASNEAFVVRNAC